ncbi:MAG: hypothetical protein R6V05_09160 [Candidatus Brocadiia bacterium]
MQSPKQLQRFPAEIGFVALSSVEFTSHVVAAGLTAEERQATIPDEWEFELGYRPAGERRYLLRMSAEAVWESVTDKAPYELTLQLIAGVELGEGLSEELVQTWLEQGAQCLMMPYARAAVADLMQGTGFPIPHLPLVAVPVLHEPADPAGVRFEGNERREDP